MSDASTKRHVTDEMPPSLDSANQVAYAPTVRNAPCAKLRTPIRP